MTERAQVHLMGTGSLLTMLLPVPLMTFFWIAGWLLGTTIAFVLWVLWSAGLGTIFHRTAQKPIAMRYMAASLALLVIQAPIAFVLVLHGT